ncbi:MAG: efflux RND transporter permease subunit [Rikenellaceae bacterium]
MIKHLINRPIAVTMSVIALMIIGLVSYSRIPISLMPDIDIPQITVQASYEGAPVRDVDYKVLRPLKNQLMQVVGLKSIRTEAKADAGTIYMDFEPGSNVDLLFIDVNEKLDRALTSLPDEVDRPKVLKASATDIPAFYLNLTLKDEITSTPGLYPEAGSKFAELGDFARNIVSKRIEQLPQTAMVDISGLVYPELLCTPDEDMLDAAGITIDELQAAVERSNISMGILSIVDGIYRYNIHFDSQLATADDVRDIYINIDGRLYQFGDLCTVEQQPAPRKGLIRSSKSNAITLAIIKQSDAQMEALQDAIQYTVDDLQRNYPEIAFELTRDQTKLLTYSMNNLRNNLLLGAFLACVVLFFFMRDLRSPLLIIITIPLALILTLMCFYIFGITLNIISLSGLILGVGMMVDNSIIVIDNISQKWETGLRLHDAVARAVGEVFSPMLSSVLTTCSVFIPLIFLSGTTGALFYDQAMAVTIALFSSLGVSVIVIPVYFTALYSKYRFFNETKLSDKHEHGGIYRPYEAVLRWVLRHNIFVIIIALLIIPSCYFIYNHVEKSRLPVIDHNDALMNIDWNSGISVEENERRVMWLLEEVEGDLTASTAMIGVQEFLLSHTKELTASEAIVYIQAESSTELAAVQNRLTSLMLERYPNGKVEFEISGNLFDMIFSEGEADLEIRLHSTSGTSPEVTDVRLFCEELTKAFPDVVIPTVITEENIIYEANIELMTLYNVTYSMLFKRLKELLNQQSFYEINQGGYSLPLTLGESRMEGNALSEMKVKNSDGVEIPISYLVRQSRGEDFKKLYSGSGGNYYPIKIIADDRKVEEIMAFANSYIRSGGGYSLSFAGEYFASREMVMELIVILTVAILLLYFILAAQFESLIQPMIILAEVIIDIFFVMLGLMILGESLNMMSLIGIVVMSGIIINDSILKVDTINNLARGGMPLIKAIYTGGHSRLKPIIMTSLTTILAIAPFLNRVDMGSALQYPLSLSLIIGMVVGTMVSLFFIPVVYYVIYKNRTV